MPTIVAGSAEAITVQPGMVLEVQTAGEAYVDRLAGLPDAGYASDRVVAGHQLYGARERAFSIQIRAIEGDAEYTLRLPDVQAGDIVFRRDDSGGITGLIDPATGDLVPIGSGDDGGSVAWGDVTGKPDAFPPAAHTHTLAQVTGLNAALTERPTGDGISAIVRLTQAAYDALDPKDPDTFYVIVG